MAKSFDSPILIDFGEVSNLKDKDVGVRIMTLELSIQNLHYLTVPNPISFRRRNIEALPESQQKHLQEDLLTKYFVNHITLVQVTV